MEDNKTESEIIAEIRAAHAAEIEELKRKHAAELADKDRTIRSFIAQPTRTPDGDDLDAIAARISKGFKKFK
jgi:hypothetical protein